MTASPDQQAIDATSLRSLSPRLFKEGAACIYQGVPPILYFGHALDCMKQALAPVRRAVEFSTLDAPQIAVRNADVS